MNEAALNEDYSQAAAAKSSIDAIKERDPLETIVHQLEQALAIEDYQSASELRDQGMLSLLGWWVGKGENGDPYGHLLHVTREYGRLVGRAYTSAQIQEIMGEGQAATLQSAINLGRSTQKEGPVKLEDTGSRVFEIYVTEEGNKQPFVLQPSEESIREIQRLKEKRDQEKDSIAETSKSDLSIMANPEATSKLTLTDEKEKLPLEVLLKQKTTEVQKLSESGFDQNQEPNELLEVVKDRNPCLLDMFGVNRFKIGAPQMSELQLGQQRVQLSAHLQLASKGIINDATKKQQMQHMIQMAVQQLSKNPTKDKAEMREQLKKILREAFKKVLGTDDLADDLVVESRQMEDVILSNEVWYDRLHLDQPLTDPFSGLYIGAFGPNGVEILQLRRQMDIQNQEWVIATKITGDLHVPAGIECFKAKVGRGQRLNADYYPSELEVVGRYKGEGRIADAGFEKPKWVEGELLIFNGGYKPMVGEADLGVMYSAPGLKHFLILLHRLDFESFQ
eukprot:TRINITY_DN5920_c0_g1_i2.p1 TRINITY_DN5920_c0_g1~~TRINITY_DN5920_c0_g1_i2.p1  ORF type:complete len:551 (+),score=80.87 TRINITY_DN5920_c0_g1_i2:136-1653(+)